MKGDGLCKVTRMMIGKREIRLDQGDERACRHACGRARGSKSGTTCVGLNGGDRGVEAERLLVRKSEGGK